jgi:hypothetical protein
MERPDDMLDPFHINPGNILQTKTHFSHKKWSFSLDSIPSNSDNTCDHIHSWNNRQFCSDRHMGSRRKTTVTDRYILSIVGLRWPFASVHLCTIRDIGILCDYVGYWRTYLQIKLFYWNAFRNGISSQFSGSFYWKVLLNNLIWNLNANNW